MLKFVKTFKVTYHIWVDGIKTEDTEERIKLFFREDKIFRGLPQTTFGSAVVQRDWTEEDIAANYNTEEDLSAYLKMGEPNEKGFCKVLPR